MRITLVGLGMGAPDCLTGEARRALEEAGIILGTERLLRSLPGGLSATLQTAALPETAAAAVLAHPEWEEVCIVLSGDIGFYSGARQLLALLGEYEPLLLPGIATPQYLAARLRRPWQDFRLVSAHGVHCEILPEVLNHPSVLFLTGGETTPGTIIDTLCDAGLGEARVTVGEELSYPGERILAGTAEELAGKTFSRLSAVLVENSRSFAFPPSTPGLDDDAFIRGGVPMTKREVRAIILSLLRPNGNGILYDIGAGTGSVAVEMALQARRGGVYAVEREPEALRLIKANKQAFGVHNLHAVWGTAPEALLPLPAPDAVFIGGSGGGMHAIVRAVLDKNPQARLVISAIALETLTAAMDAVQACGLPDPEVIQVAASRAVARNGLHLLQARNPVFLIAGGGRAR